jgi:hypothetical protein
MTLLGVPFFNNTPYSLGIVEQGQQILGDNLIALQAGNEPDLYAQPPRTHRPLVGNCSGSPNQLANGALRVMVRSITWVTLACLSANWLTTP